MGVHDPLGQAINWLWEQTASALETVENAIKARVDEAKNAIITDISNVISSTQSTILKPINDVLANVTDISETIPDIVSSVNKVVKDITALAQKAEDIWQDVKFTSDFVLKIPDLLDGLKFDITTSLSLVQKSLQDSFLKISNDLISLQEVFTSQLLAVQDTLQKTFYDAATEIAKAFNEALDKVKSEVWEAKVVLQGFNNSLLQMFNLFNTIWRYIRPLFDWDSVVYATISVTKQIFHGLQDFNVWLWEAGVVFVDNVREYIANAIMRVRERILDLLESINKEIAGFVEEKFLEPSKELTEKLYDYIEEHYKQGTEGEFRLLMSALPTVILPFGLAKLMASAVYYIGDWLKDTEVSLEPLGLGVRFKIPLGHLIMGLGDTLSDVAKEGFRGVVYALSFWSAEPLSRMVKAVIRNRLPVELPTLGELIEITRRVMPTNEFQQFLGTMEKTLALYGYSDQVIGWFTKKAEEWYVEVKDRFGKSRRLPVSLLYEVPSKSDLITMFMRDVFYDAQQFEKAIQMQGLTPDVARLYYMLHFKYPSLSKLWEFATRVVAGFGWVDLKAQEEYGLGFSGPSPKDLSTQLSGDPKTGLQTMLKFIQHYAKWQDYAPFAWIQNFTSDRAIILDLMADIPQRIDARWMYKWGIIEDKDLYRIVIARGMHPDWWDKIATAECLNALAEERTLARTGLLNAFEYGFLDAQTLEQKLSSLIKIKILNKDVEVKFLPGEVALLKLRALYDRALDILKDYSKELIVAYRENLVSLEDIKKNLASAVQEAAQKLQIDLKFDSTWLEALKPSLEIEKQLYTIRRVRTWVRYTLNQILYRVRKGYLSKDEAYSLIDNIAKEARMTNEEIQLLKEIVDFLMQEFYRDKQISAILRRLSRGVISKAEALQKLQGLGLDKETAEALIEEKAKVYTMTLTTLVSLAENMPIDEKYFEEKMELLGVPKKERKLWRARIWIDTHKEEIEAIARELGEAYVKGVISESEFKRKLDELATLKWPFGRDSRRDFGLDWVVLSPEERKALIERYKLKKARMAKS